VPRTHPNVSRRSAHPSTGVSGRRRQGSGGHVHLPAEASAKAGEAKRQSPGAAMRARERDGLFDMVKNAASDGRPHPASRRPRPEEARSAVSKDEDEPLRAPSCFETHRIAANLRSMHALLRCDAPQREGGGWAAHFGQTNPTIILAKRSQAAAWARRTNLRLHEMIAGPASLFPPCSLQGTLQPQRVSPSVVPSGQSRQAQIAPRSIQANSSTAPADGGIGLL
jgi:hypothetical protein